jgi:flagellar motor switch protein FliN
LKNDTANHPTNQEKVLEPLALAFAAGFTQAARKALQSTASVSCTKVENSSLRDLLTDTSSPMGIEVHFDAGIVGNALLVIAKSDLARIAGLLAGLECDEATAIDHDFMEANLQFFAAGLDACGKNLAQSCGLSIHGSAPRVINPDGSDMELQRLADAYATVPCLTFQVKLENLPEDRFLLLVHRDLLAALNAQLPHYAAPEPGPVAAPRNSPSSGGGAGAPSQQSRWNIDLILDVELGVAVSFGETQLPLRDVLKLGVGSVIELEKGVNDPVTICVNDKPIVRGEVVVVNGNYGVKVLEVESTVDRIRSLGRQ